MAEYFERKAAIAIIEEKQKELCPVGRYGRGYVYGSDREKYDAWDEIIDALENIPAADVAPVVHGRWIPSESDFDDDDTLFDVEEWCDWQCSACGEDICYDDPMPALFLPKYCPNCGAKMDGGVDND